MNTIFGKKLLFAFATAIGTFCILLHPITLSAQIKERSVSVNTQKASEMDEVSLRQKMKDDGLSEPVIDKLIAQRKQWMKKGKNVMWSNVKKSSTNPSTHAVCGDMGGENGWGSWSAVKGDNSFGNPPTWNAPFSPPTAQDFNITSGAGIDANTPGGGGPAVPVVAPNGFGNHSIQIGQPCTSGCLAWQLTYPLTVTAQDTSFIYSYAIVIEDAGHAPVDQPYVDLSIYDTNGNVIPCGAFHYTGGANIPGFYYVNGTGCGLGGVDQYKPWTLVGVNLSAFLGQTLNIVITNVDCDLCGHFAYSYWDFMCNSVAGSSANYCQGLPASICAPSDPNITYNYQWYQNGTLIPAPQGTQACITQMVTPGDTFSVDVKQPSGCNFHEKFAPQQISMLPGFKDSIHCNHVFFYDTTTVTNSSLFGWSWNFGDASTSLLQNPSHVYTSAGTYTVSLIVTCAAGCKDTVKNTVTILPFPTVNAGPDVSVCQGSITTLCATVSSGTMTYVWLPANQTTTCLSVNAITSTYTVTGTGPTGCVASDMVNVAVVSPSVTATGGSFCTNNPNCVTLNAVGGASYTWSPATALSSTTGHAVVACPTITTTYTVVGTDSIYGCTYSKVATVIAYTPPTVSAGPISTYCPGQSPIHLTSSSNPAGSSYVWSPSTGLSNPNISNPTATPPSSTTYSVTITSVNGCTNTASVAITVGVIPVITTSPAVTICHGQTTTMLTASSNPANVSYSWSPTTGLGNSTNQNTSADPATSTTYTVTVTTTLGCTSSATVPVTVGTVPNVTAGPISTICLGKTTVNLFANANPPGASYAWTPSAGLSCTTCSNPNASPSFSSTYSVTVTTALGCTAVATVPISVGTIPVVSASASTSICTGDSAQLNSNPNNGLAPYTYYWFPPNNLNNPNVQNPLSGTVLTTNYVVTVTDANGCTADTTTTVFVQSRPSVAWTTWNPGLTCDGYTIPLKANVNGTWQSIYWNFGDGSSVSQTNANAVPHTYPFGGTYSISVTVYNTPCLTTLDTSLTVSDVMNYVKILPANVFTPNGDSRNECFHPAICDLAAVNPTTPCPQDSLVELFKTCVDLEVYDRWGIKIFKSSDTQKCWDGSTMSGSPAKDGTYYYIAKFREMILRGYVELIR